MPTWGSSLCHSGGSSPEEDLDLEGLRFTDMPWFAAGESALRGATQGVVPAGGIERLVALGADAARLQSRLALLDWAAGGGLGGASGELYLANARIRRQSDWFVFTQGQARAELERSPLGAIAPPPQASTEGDTTWQVTPQAPRADARPKISP